MVEYTVIPNPTRTKVRYHTCMCDKCKAMYLIKYTKEDRLHYFTCKKCNNCVFPYADKITVARYKLTRAFREAKKFFYKKVNSH